MAFAFCGASPQDRMIASMRATGSRPIAVGAAASAHKRGVTSFTRRSVHCAESTTATSSV